jgi:hypothetical protein
MDTSSAPAQRFPVMEASIVLRLVLVAMAAALCALYVLYKGPVALAAAVLAVAVLGAHRRRMARPFDPFEPIVAATALFVASFPLRALVGIWLEDSWVQDGLTTPLIFSIVGFGSFLVGYSKTKTGPPVPFQWNRVRLRIFSTACLVVSAASFLFVRFSSGFWQYFTLIDSDVKAPDAMPAWFFYAFWAAMAVQIGALLELDAFLDSNCGATYAATYWVIAVASTILLSRYSTVMLLLYSAVLYHYKRKRLTLAKLALVGLLAVPYLLVAGFWREAENVDVSVEEIANMPVGNLALRYIVGNFEQLRNAQEVLAHVPSSLPYQYGKTAGALLLKPIPRTILPSKPLGASGLFTREFYPDAFDAGFATIVSAQTEFYMNFGWVGVVLGMALLGRCSGWLYGLSARSPLWFAVWLGGLIAWLRMDFSAASNQVLFFAIPLAAGLWFVQERVPVPGGRPLIVNTFGPH